MIEAEILASPPISGTVDEVQFDAVGACLWVRFSNTGGSEWCGIFGPGMLGGRAAVIGTGGQCFVIASGQGYLVDVKTRRLLHKTQHDCLIAAIAIPGRDIFVACTYTNLFAYSASGEVWRSRRVSIDGIVLSEASPSLLKGLAWDLERWRDFVLDIEGWTYRSEFECPWD